MDALMVVSDFLYGGDGGLREGRELLARCWGALVPTDKRPFCRCCPFVLPSPTVNKGLVSKAVVAIS